jgi:GNAT superfamily N-acetyltransferase
VSSCPRTRPHVREHGLTMTVEAPDVVAPPGERQRDHSAARPSAPFVVRKMTEADLDRAMAILACWNMAPRAASAEEPDPERDRIDIANGFVAVEDGRVVGVCSYFVHGRELVETASLAVDPSCKTWGIGEALQEARLDEMRRRGFRKVRTEADRPKVIAWYKRKFGYTEVGKNPKKHAFSLSEVDVWTVLELDLQ